METPHAMVHIQGDTITMLLKEHCRQFKDDAKVAGSVANWLKSEGFLNEGQQYGIIYGYPAL